MHSCELITNSRVKKVLCHHLEVVKNFRSYNHRLCFLQRDWLSSNSSWKSNQLNEARGIGRRSPDPFSLVRGRGLGTRLGVWGLGMRLFTPFHVPCHMTHRGGGASIPGRRMPRVKAALHYIATSGITTHSRCSPLFKAEKKGRIKSISCP